MISFLDLYVIYFSRSEAPLKGRSAVTVPGRLAAQAANIDAQRQLMVLLGIVLQSVVSG